MKKKLLSALLTLTMCTGLLPATAFAADVVPTIETIDYTYVYANGVPIVIEAGKMDPSLTSVYYMDGEEKVYLDLDPKTEGEQTEAILSDSYIFGGSKDRSVTSTSITMTGGSVNRIYSGGYQQEVIGDTSVVFEGGTASGILNGSLDGAVGGTAMINVSDGKISQISSSGTIKNSIFRMTGGEILGSVCVENAYDSVTDTIEITVTGGKLGGSVQGENPTSTQTTSYGYIAPSTMSDYDLIETNTFDHLLYKTDSGQYAAFGDIPADFTVKNFNTLTVNEGKTLTIPEGMTLTAYGSLFVNGTLINEGTIINNSDMQINGTLTNQGTINNNLDMQINGTLANQGTIISDREISGTITDAGGTVHICYTEVEYGPYEPYIHKVICKDCPIENCKTDNHILLEDTGKCICGLDIEAEWTRREQNFYVTSVEDIFIYSSTIKFLKDIRIAKEEIVVTNSPTLDLNGHTLDLGDAKFVIDTTSYIGDDVFFVFTIEDSSAEKTGRITGNGTSANIYLIENGRIAVTENFAGTLSVEKDEPGIFAEGMAEEAEHFISADDKYLVTEKGDDLYLMGDFSEAEVTVADLTYKGEAYEKSDITVSFDGKPLSSNDYEVTWPADMINAGEKTVQVTHKNTNDFSGTATGTFNINPKELTVTGATATDRPYDASKTVKITGVTVNGICGSDSVQVDCSDLKGTLESADAGTYNSVTLPAMTLKNAEGNYTLKQPEEAVPTSVVITKLENTRSGDWTNPITNDLAKEYQIDFSGCEPSLGEWGEDKIYSCQITYFEDGAMSVYKDKIQAKIDANGLLTVSVPKVETDVEGTAAVVTVTINSQNYENWTKELLLIASNREIVTLDVFTPEKSYDGEAMAEEDIEVTAMLNNAEVTDISGYTYHWKDTEGNTLEQAPVNVGSYQLMVSVKADDTKYVGSITVPVTITKGEPDIGILYNSITGGGKTLKDAELELDGNSTPGTLVWVLPETTAVAANTEYEWKFTPDDSVNYKEMTGTIILWEKAVSSGGSGGDGSSSSTTVTNKGDSTEIDTSSGTISESNADKAIDKAVENDSDEIIIDTNKDKVTLPADMAENIADKTDADLVVETKNGIVTIPNGTLEDLDAEGKVTVAVTKDKVTISDEDGEMSDIGEIKVTVPYKENNKTGNVAVEVTKADGTKEVIEDVYDGKNSVTFEVDGSVTFEIIDDYVPLADGPVVPVENPFKDVSETDWFYDAVMYVSENGLMSGVDADNFGPSVNTTRGMITTILWRMEGKPESGVVPFIDVDADMYYADAIAWAAANGIVSGYDAVTFGPDDNITREQLASILYRYAKYKGEGFEGLWAFRLDFIDVAELSEYAYEPMCWCVMNGIISGNDDGTLNPGGHAQRSHAAQMLMKFDKNIK